ncbi:peptidase protein [Penicillium waksmanii]|uniref:peptidase protein n=1 Tax=Penicillium waksmanii TaxID=69791 RepID=UPI002546DBF3|nr:peptidase protein [Penicillium waksmanii]KAJ5973199.1 peptidase protein [Penicillium waksmanii]
MSEGIENSLISAVDNQQAQLLSITQELVQQNSSNPPGDVSTVATIAARIIGEVIPSSKVSIYEAAPGTINVVAVIQGKIPGHGRKLVFSGHLDTYPIGDEEKWTFPPLGGVISEDGTRLYARGATDMKGGIATSIIAASVLAEHNEHWSGEIVIALAGDEETMGTLGSGYLLEHVNAVSQCDAMICGDAGSPAVLRVGEKGLVWVEINATGSPAHGAHVHRGSSAIERLIGAISALKDLENLPVQNPQDVEDIITEAKTISEPLGGAGEERTLKRITVNIGTISGGVSANLVAHKAQAEADIRLPMAITASRLVEHIHTVLDPLEGISFQITRQYDPSWTSPSQEIVRHTLAAARAVVSNEAAPVINLRVGASDARLFRQKGIPSVIVGLTPHNMGGPDEYVQIEELSQVAKIHTLAAWRYLKA